MQNFIIFLLENGSRVSASHDHLFQKSNNEWCYAKDLKENDVLLTKDGSSRISEMQLKMD
jgi:hypothetical protein